MAQFTNQAQLSYNNSVTNSNIAVGEILEVLSATKTALTDSYIRNDNIVYIISIINSGAIDITGLTVTDNLGSYAFNQTQLVPLEYVEGSIRYYINGVLQTPPTVTTPPFTVSGIDVPAEGNAIIIYETTTNQFAPLELNGSITNSAVISGNGITPITISETVETQNAADLTITKSISPVPVTENGRLTYTFYIQNSGNTEAGSDANIVITDVFNPILTNISVTLNGSAFPTTSYNYNETTGVFQSVSGTITVPAATYTQDATDGRIVITPGIATLVITGTV